jgi:hypothetical protein
MNPVTRMRQCRYANPLLRFKIPFERTEKGGGNNRMSLYASPVEEGDAGQEDARESGGWGGGGDGSGDIDARPGGYANVDHNHAAGVEGAGYAEVEGDGYANVAGMEGEDQATGADGAH